MGDNGPITIYHTGLVDVKCLGKQDNLILNGVEWQNMHWKNLVNLSIELRQLQK